MPVFNDTAELNASRGTIGLAMHRYGGLVCGLDDKVITGIMAECKALRLDLMIRYFSRSREFRALAIPFSMQVNALIVAGPPHPDLTGDLVRLNRDYLPVVTINDRPVHKDVPNIGSDQVGLGRKATEHLIAGGCKRIVLLPFPGMDARMIGFKQAMREAGLPIEQELLPSPGPAVDELYCDGFACEAITDLIERKIKFDGIFAQSDVVAMGAMRALYKAGVKIPDDVQIIGVDNQPFCHLTPQKLSSVTIPSRLYTAYAVRMAVDRLRGRKVESVSCDARVFARETTLAEIREKMLSDDPTPDITSGH